jgi:hypothetical protein
MRSPRAAALDVHKKTVCACIREAKEDGEVVPIQETFQTFTDDLERLRDWLKQHEVRRVAMESTGVYWIPVWNVLEPKTHGLELLVVNPPTLVKALPGCKTDEKDAARIAELHQYGLFWTSPMRRRPRRAHSPAWIVYRCGTRRHPGRGSPQAISAVRCFAPQGRPGETACPPACTGRCEPARPSPGSPGMTRSHPRVGCSNTRIRRKDQR